MAVLDDCAGVFA